MVYLFTDDMKDYFNQLRLAAEEEWKSVVTTLAMPGDPGYDAARPSMVYVNERVLGFGTTRSSNYAQRLSNTLMDITRERALEPDRQISADLPLPAVTPLAAPPQGAWRKDTQPRGQEVFQPLLHRRRPLRRRGGGGDDQLAAHMAWRDC